jgi:diguanylate cyclase (GGDEF)-like protein
MISLRKAMEAHGDELLQCALESYGSSLAATAEAGALAYPPEGESLKASLLNLSLRLNVEASAPTVAETGKAVNGELQAWGERASGFYQQKLDELREVLTLVADAAGKVADRDERYAKQFEDLSGRLETTAKLKDLTEIRRSLIQGVAELKASAARMVQEGQVSVGKLRSQVAVYEARMKEAERIAAQDALTELANRREMERQIERRVEGGRPFGVIYLDLNGFKSINDTYGHKGGDELLKQFAQELKVAVRATDVAGRWGGDEFLVLVDGDLSEAESRARRVEEWVNGEYTLTAGGERKKVRITAGTGAAAWKKGDSAQDVVQRADAAMYGRKPSTASGKPVG